MEVGEWHGANSVAMLTVCFSRADANSTYLLASLSALLALLGPSASIRLRSASSN